MFRKKKVVWLLLLPGLAGLMLFYVVPFFGGIYSSLMDGSFENQFVGLANYERTLQNSMFQLGLKNTWELSLLCAPVIWLLAFLLAAMLKTLKDRSTAFRNILLLPYLMPSSAMLLIWTLMFDYGGVINRMVTALGMERVLWLEGDDPQATDELIGAHMGVEMSFRLTGEPEKKGGLFSGLDWL